MLPKLYRKVYYSISAAIHSKVRPALAGRAACCLLAGGWGRAARRRRLTAAPQVVRVRSREARRIREPPKRFRPQDGKKPGAPGAAGGPGKPQTA